MPYSLVTIDPDYPIVLTERCRNMVAYVFDDKWKMVCVSVIAREALPKWFEEKRAKHTPHRHHFIVANISIAGEVYDNITAPADMTSSKAPRPS